MSVPRSLLGAAVCVVIAMCMAGCTTTAWDTTQANHPTSSTIPFYPSTTNGLIASITDHLSTVGPDLNEWAPNRKSAKSAATKIVAHLGLNRMLDLGFQPQTGRLNLPYNDDERTAVTNILTGCIDFANGLLSMYTGYQKIGLTSAGCVTDGIERQGLTRDFAAAFVNGQQPDPSAQNDRLGLALTALFNSCLTPSSDLVPGSPTPRFPTGLDPTTTTTPH